MKDTKQLSYALMQAHQKVRQATAEREHAIKAYFTQGRPVHWSRGNRTLKGHVVEVYGDRVRVLTHPAGKTIWVALYRFMNRM